MERIKIIIAAIACCISGMINVQAQDCELPVAVVIDEQPKEIPDAAVSVLENSLMRLATASGLNTDFSFSNFILTAKIDVLGKDIIPGPPVQISRGLGITLYLGDVSTQTKFASAYVETAGVGTNDTKCMVEAFRRLNANNADIQRMISSGKQKMLAYYDKNYKTILKEAERKAALQQYEEAIALAVSVPVCSKGGDEAQNTGLRIYGQYRDKINQILLNKARVIWATSQDSIAAMDAGQLLSQIDPDATCYVDAVSFANEIKNKIRNDIDFEIREKYKDGVKLEESRIGAMRAIGVAFGKGQQPKTTNITWLR